MYTLTICEEFGHMPLVVAEVQDHDWTWLRGAGERHIQAGRAVSFTIADQHGTVVHLERATAYWTTAEAQAVNVRAIEAVAQMRFAEVCDLCALPEEELL